MRCLKCYDLPGIEFYAKHFINLNTEHASSSLAWSETPKIGFLAAREICQYSNYSIDNCSRQKATWYTRSRNVCCYCLDSISAKLTHLSYIDWPIHIQLGDSICRFRDVLQYI